MNDPLVLCRTPELIGQLRHFDELPLEELWASTILCSEENMDRVGNNMYNLLMASTGLHNMNETIRQQLEQDTAEVGSQIQDPTNSYELHGAALTLLKKLQQNQSIESVSEDVKGKMPLMDGEMLRALVQAVCPEQLQALGGGIEGLFSGSTGAPAFGDAVPHPAWLSKKE
jgi:hypothetical protein